MSRIRSPAALSAALCVASLGAPAAFSQEFSDKLFSGAGDPISGPVEEETVASDTPSEDDGRATAEPVVTEPPAEAPPPIAADDHEDGVPGAASTEPVLRCVYRPDPSRVPAIYEFLKANAAAGVDVSVRPVDRVASGEAPQLTGAPTPDAFGDVSESNARRTARPTGAEGGPLELVVVAPPEVQRALGQFLQLCVSAEPAAVGTQRAPVGNFGADFGAPLAPRPARPVDGFEDPLPADFGGSRPARPSTRDAFSAFGEDPAAFDDLDNAFPADDRPTGDPFEAPKNGGDFGGDPMERPADGRRNGA